MNGVVIAEDRIKQMLELDKRENPIKIEKIIKSEIFCILKDYMDISMEDIDFDIGIDNDGKYIVSLNACANRLYLTNYLL